MKGNSIGEKECGYKGRMRREMSVEDKTVQEGGQIAIEKFIQYASHQGFVAFASGALWSCNF